MGRIMYESFYGAWPYREGRIADKINTMTKYVASTTLGSSEWHDTTVIASDVPSAVAELKQSDGGPILVAGSRSLVHDLLEAGLVDELNVRACRSSSAAARGSIRRPLGPSGALDRVGQDGVGEQGNDRGRQGVSHAGNGDAPR
jgi:hypothetical protein